MRAALVLLLLVPLVPTVHAAGLPGGCFFTVASACATDAESGDDCDVDGETGAAETTLFVLTPAGLVTASGRSSCAPGWRYEGAYVQASSGANVVVVEWSEVNGRCGMTAIAFAAGQYRNVGEPCAAGNAPNPGWGHLLP